MAEVTLERKGRLRTPRRPGYDHYGIYGEDEERLLLSYEGHEDAHGAVTGRSLLEPPRYFWTTPQASDDIHWKR